MNTNGFAAFTGADASSRARSLVERVQRFNKQVVVSTGEDCVVAFSLQQEEGWGYPLVHGFMKEGRGEFAYLRKGEGGYVAGRDLLGTRGLYVDETWSCVASDHRFFPARPRLMPRGSEIETASRKVVTAEIVAEPSGLSLEEAAIRLAELLRASVKRRVADSKKVAVSFSGGLDSSLVAFIASKETSVVLCTAYAAGSRDQEQTRAAADAMGLDLVAKEIGKDDVAEEVRSLDLPFQPSPMDRTLWSLYSTTSRIAAEQGAGLILLGQLADELFGGYMKYALTAKRSPKDAEAMMRADVEECGVRAFIRDEEACARFAEARFPFADESVASFALGLPLVYKISGGERKIVLRRTAALLGLPAELVEAPKKAAQYSSGIAKLLP
ncbi:MAG: asparagine synthase-related protein [Nitrososphaerales archaeon]|jgi:asparagine synthetase B (glutamine-hydrolysing)